MARNIRPASGNRESAEFATARPPYIPSKPRQLREFRLAPVHMHPPALGAAVQPGEHLAGVQQAVGVKGALDLLLAQQVGLAELVFHQVAVLDADAVLTGQHAADIDAQTQNVRAERLGALDNDPRSSALALPNVLDAQAKRCSLPPVRRIDLTPPVLWQINEISWGFCSRFSNSPVKLSRNSHLDALRKK